MNQSSDLIMFPPRNVSDVSDRFRSMIARSLIFQLFISAFPPASQSAGASTVVEGVVARNINYLDKHLTNHPKHAVKTK